MTINMAIDLVGEENIIIFYENGKGYFRIIGSTEKFEL